VAQLNVVSTRNFSTTEKYVELARGVEASCKLNQNDCTSEAINRAVASVDGGEYMTNVIVYQTNSRVKVVGDVWGRAKGDTLVAAPVSSIKVGSLVNYTDNRMRTTKVTVVACEPDRVTIQFLHSKQPPVKVAITAITGQ
jgi:hypothetical protein